jgi:hypothetical protein
VSVTPIVMYDQLVGAGFDSFFHALLIRMRGQWLKKQNKKTKKQ